MPIIIVTARAQKSDKLKGLNLGADDYVTKPFEMDELLARVRAVLRRTRTVVDCLTLGRVFVDFRIAHAPRASGTELHLTHREFEVLRYLAERQERVVHRDELLREVWGYIDAPSTRSVDHAIARLRKKIENDPPHPAVHPDRSRRRILPDRVGLAADRTMRSRRAALRVSVSCLPASV